MPPRDWRLRIEDILECIGKISHYTDGMGVDAFRENGLVVDAVIRNISVIGEAARHVPDDVVARHPDLPWDEMRGMRNVLVHEYFGADIDTIWETARRDLPPLVAPLKKLLDQHE